MLKSIYAYFSNLRDTPNLKPSLKIGFFKSFVLGFFFSLTPHMISDFAWSRLLEIYSLEFTLDYLFVAILTTFFFMYICRDDAKLLNHLLNIHTALVFAVILFNTFDFFYWLYYTADDFAPLLRQFLLYIRPFNKRLVRFIFYLVTKISVLMDRLRNYFK